METSRRMLRAERLIMMAIELDHAPDSVWAAVDELADERLGTLLEILQIAPPGSPIPDAAWHRAVTPARLRALIDADPPDLETLERVLSKIGEADAGLLLDLLVESESLATRKRLFTRLGQLAPRIAAEIVRRLSDERWFARRNLLALIGEIPQWPPKWSPAAHADDPHPAVRREAYKLMLRDPGQRDRAVCGLLEDADRKAQSLGLAAATELCPPEAIPLLSDLAQDDRLGNELRLMAIRALGQTTDPAAIDTLVELVRRGSGLARNRLAEKSPVMLAALQALTTFHEGTPDSRKLIARAAKSQDPAIRAAVGA